MSVPIYMTKTPYYRPGYARVGAIVSMRHRYQQFLNEPYDIVHPNQPFGYVNAKYRPCLIVGTTDTSVVVAPIKRLEHQPRWLEVENGGFVLEKETIIAAGLNQQCEGMAIGCAELREIPKTDFTYRRIFGILPPATFKAYLCEMKAYEVSRKQSTHPLQFQFDAGRPEDLSFCNTKTLWIKWHDPRESCLIHKNDLINQFANAKATLSQFLEKTPVTTMSEDEQAYHLKLRQKVAKLEAKQNQYSPNPKYELREHFLAIQHGYGTSRDQVRHHAYSKRK